MGEERLDDTLTGTFRGPPSEVSAGPGLLVVFSGSRPTRVPLALEAARVEVGRMLGGIGMLLPDERLSRAHAELTRMPTGWLVRDLGSRNGTFVDGDRITGEVFVREPRVIRLADTLLLPVEELDRRPPPPPAPLSLREHPSEIPQLIAEAIAAVDPDMSAHPRLVEVCLLRAWPGDADELREALRGAASRAHADRRQRVRVEHLAPEAACAPAEPPPAVFPADRATPPAPAPKPAPEGPVRRRSYVRWSLQLTREDIERTIAQHGGNIALAARALGMQRSQLYREMARWSVSPKTLKSGG